MRDRLGESQKRREAKAATLHKSAPPITRLAAKHLSETSAQNRPFFPIFTGWRVLVVDTGTAQQFVVEFLFPCGNADIEAIFCLIDLVPRRGAIEQVFSARIAPGFFGTLAVNIGHQR